VTVPTYPYIREFTIAWLIALAVLIVALILIFTDRGSVDWTLGLIAALAVTRLVP
jgi:hypothetical protein